MVVQKINIKIKMFYPGKAVADAVFDFNIPLKSKGVSIILESVMYCQIIGFPDTQVLYICDVKSFGADRFPT